MAFVGLLALYTIFVLFARRTALGLWRGMREHGPDALVIRVPRLPRLRDIGWGVALVPVTLFGAKTLAGSDLFSLVTVVTVAAYAVAQPRRAGYLAAAGLTGLGAWVLYEGVALPPAPTTGSGTAGSGTRCTSRNWPCSA